MVDEREIIEKFFLNAKCVPSFLVAGIGDDAAILEVPDNQQLVVTTDTLNAGIHFVFQDNNCLEENSCSVAPFDIGYKAAAVNLSDLGAMGAKPWCVSLALSLPEINEAWLKKFSEGLFSLLNQFNVPLIGGDLTRGPLSITLTAQGLVDSGKAIRRSTAMVGDDIYVSGELGGAAYTLARVQAENLEMTDQLSALLNRPIPRVALGRELSELATSAIDISDGLAHDLTQILMASQCGADVDVENLPLHKALKAIEPEQAIRYALTGGDDYELCFTANRKNRELINAIAASLKLPLTRIGRISKAQGLHLHQHGATYPELDELGFEHFR